MASSITYTLVLWLVVKHAGIMAFSKLKNHLKDTISVISDIWFHDKKHTVIMACIGLQ